MKAFNDFAWKIFMDPFLKSTEIYLEIFIKIFFQDYNIFKQGFSSLVNAKKAILARFFTNQWVRKSKVKQYAYSIWKDKSANMDRSAGNS